MFTITAAFAILAILGVTYGLTYAATPEGATRVNLWLTATASRLLGRAHTSIEYEGRHRATPEEATVTSLEPVTA